MKFTVKCFKRVIGTNHLIKGSIRTSNKTITRIPKMNRMISTCTKEAVIKIKKTDWKSNVIKPQSVPKKYGFHINYDTSKFSEVLHATTFSLF